MAPKKVEFLLELLAPPLGLRLVDQARVQVGVDRHLLAGHRVQGEARGHLGDAGRALGDDHEVHDDQDREHDQADDEVALHHQLAEGLDGLARRLRALVAVAQDQARGGEVQPQPVEGGDQQDGRKRGELQRLLDQQRRHQDQHRGGDRDRQQKIEHDAGHRHDQQDDDQADAQRHRHFAARDPAPHLLEGGGLRGETGGAGVGHQVLLSSREKGEQFGPPSAGDRSPPTRSVALRLCAHRTKVFSVHGPTRTTRTGPQAPAGRSKNLNRRERRDQRGETQSHLCSPPRRPRRKSLRSLRFRCFRAPFGRRGRRVRVGPCQSVSVRGQTKILGPAFALRYAHNNTQ